jgi:EAL domain-containing protein (putative c-di-GMP-specific phosphodiesterase class I)
MSPAFFIPALEETGLIMPIGEWVIRTACRQLREWDQSGMEPIKIAINVSAEQFLDENLTSYFASAIKENGIDSTFLEIEITESSLMADAKKTVEVLQELKMLGVRISIDDFGTGYSSLAYLRKFPIDKLKIDIAFIRDVTTNASDAAITTAIINMAHSLNMKVIAEGVETREQLEFLRARKCDEFQGYYFSKPLPAVELEKLQKKALLELSQ